MRLPQFHHRYRSYSTPFGSVSLIFDHLPDHPGTAISEAEKGLYRTREIPGYLHKNTPQAKALEAAVLRYKGLKQSVNSPTLDIEYLDADKEYINVGATLANIEGLLPYVKEKDKTDLTLIKIKLEQFAGLATTNLESIGLAEAADPAQIKFYAERLVLLDKNLSQAKETNKSWPSNEIYQKVTAIYEEYLGRPNFKSLRTDINGQFDQKREGEHKALFLTLMAKETVNFTKMPALPDGSAIQGLEDPAFDAYTYNQLSIFQAALQGVDQQGGEGNLGEVFHPSIRRLIVENFYKQATEKGHENDSGVGNDWIFVQLSQAPYFRSEVPGDDTGNAQRAALAVAFAGGRAAEALEKQENGLKLIEENQGEFTWEEIEEVLVKEVNLELTSDMKLNMTPKDFIEKAKITLAQNRDNYKAFLEVARDIIQRPFDETGVHPALTKLNEGGDGGLGFIQAGDLTQFNLDARATEMNYSMTQLGEKIESGGLITSLEKMGMSLKNTHDLYSEAIHADNSLNIENWDEMLDKQPDKLANLLQSIIQPSETEEEQHGRMALLVTLRSLNQPTSDPKVMQARQIMRGRVSEIRRVIEKENEIRRQDTDPGAILLKEAMKAPPSVKEVILGPLSKLKNMLFSGDYFDMALSGTILIAGATLIMRGFKNMDKWWGKLVAGVVGGTIAVAGIEEITGKRFGNLVKKIAPDELEKAAEKTPELVLVNEGEEKMKEKNVTRNENLRGLLALGERPFKDVLAWHRTFKGKEGPYDAQKEARLFRQMGVNPNLIIDDDVKPKEKELRVKHILSESIERQLEFVAKQRNKPVNKVESILDDVYVKAAEIKGYTPRERNIIMNPTIYREFHGRQDKLTFGEVLKKEVNPYLIENALMPEPWGPAVALAPGETAEAALDTANSVVNKVIS